MAAAHSSFLAWKTPRAEEPAGYSPWDHKELDISEQLTLSSLPYFQMGGWFSKY